MRQVDSLPWLRSRTPIGTAFAALTDEGARSPSAAGLELHREVSRRRPHGRVRRHHLPAPTCASVGQRRDRAVPQRSGTAGRLVQGSDDNVVGRPVGLSYRRGSDSRQRPTLETHLAVPISNISVPTRNRRGAVAGEPSGSFSGRKTVVRRPCDLERVSANRGLRLSR